ncbi:MAG TPA: efflux RND transporter permease subunit [Candidatus Ozemobacteraceae bacterium]|nr:efflux RND transporter permease subunit [Candidatus Ozemobacteraceae bacterium]HQG27012.1 efflux RND transporter permease subunit [Candidatus Ozemobacteraceae bacterium]
MSVWKTSVRRPIGTTMMTLMVAVFGFVSLYHLPIDLMPDMTYPTISLATTYPNASPVEVETLITRPIEQALSAVPGVDELSSESTEGRSRVRVSFNWGTDLDAAANDIRDRLDRIISRLPDGVERPTLRKFDMSAVPILMLGASAQLDPVQLLKLIEDQVKYRIERIPGVASIDIQGGRKREIHVNLLPERLKALNIRVDQVVSRLKQENINLPAGIIEAGNYELTVRTPGEFSKIDQIRDIVILETGSSRVRLGEVARIEDRWEKARQIIRINGRPGVRISVNKQSGKNTVEIADAVQAEIQKINQDIPQLRLTTIMDSSKYIKRSINNVSSSAVQGGFLAIFILLVFLGDIWTTLVIGTSIPLSIIATFALMYYNGFTLNIMSLGGVALGIGMLVDNSIVVLENIFRLRENGIEPNEAAIRGTGEVAAPIFASTMTTVVIFLPLLFVEGMTGVMFKQLSWVVSFSLMCSILVAITLVPMLSARFIRISGKGEGGSVSLLTRLSRRFIGFFERRYLEVLRLVLAWPKAAGTGVIVMLGLCLGLAKGIPTEFMPTADEGEVRVTAEMEVGTRLSLVEERMAQIESRIRKAVPELVDIVYSVGQGAGGGGGGGHGAVNTGEMRIPLVGKDKRTRSSARIAVDLRSVLADIPGVRIRTREGTGMFLMRMGAGSADKVQVQIRGNDLDTADRLAKRVERLLAGIDGISDIRLSRESGAPERLISIDRQRAADQKLTVSKIAEYLETVLSGTGAGNFRDNGDEYRILVKGEEPERMSLEDILDLTVLNSAGRRVALRNVASIVERQGPILVERVDQERVVNLTADPGVRPLGTVLAEVGEILRSVPLPNGFSLNLGGDYEEQQRAFRELLLSFVLAVFLVYMVMAVQYESLLDPLIVMATVPLSSIGVILALLVTGTSFNVQSFIGCIMLGGIVVNNSILLVDHTNMLHRERGMDLDSALIEAGRDRFRPVLMTALTTILGLGPLALGWGEGGEVQAPMARVVIGGLLCATIISLTIIPVVYSLFYTSKTTEGRCDA